jgi:hypothetical protein
MMNAMLTDSHEDNMTGEPDAVKAACPVRKGIERKGLAATPRSQSTLHPQKISCFTFSVVNDLKSEQVLPSNETTS